MVSKWMSIASLLLWLVTLVPADQLDNANAQEEAAQALQAMEEATKRGGAGFLPMRGRRVPDEDNTEGQDKRASSFMPMRGRKDFPEQDVQDDLLEDKRASSFMPSRGRKDDPFMEDMEDKRASAFMPMRGRKDDPALKRLSSFMPMRGRKSIAYSALSYPAFSELRGRKKAYGSKRLNSAFMPMRGKKDDVREDDVLEEEKRLAPGSFFGMRGKRHAPAMKATTRRP